MDLGWKPVFPGGSRLEVLSLVLLCTEKAVAQWRPASFLTPQVRFLGKEGSMSLSKFSLIAVTTSCQESLVSPHGQRLLTLREGPWKSWQRHPVLPDLSPLLPPELEREALEEGSSPVRGSQGVGTRVWSTKQGLKLAAPAFQMRVKS